MLKVRLVDVSNVDPFLIVFLVARKTRSVIVYFNEKEVSGWDISGLTTIEVFLKSVKEIVSLKNKNNIQGNFRWRREIQNKSRQKL